MPERVAKESRRRRWSRALRRIVVTLFVGLIALLLLHQALIDFLLVPWLEGEIGRALGLTVSIDSLSLEPSGRLTVRRIEAVGEAPRTPVASLVVERLEVAVSPLGLLRGDGVGAVRVTVDDLDLELDLDALPPPDAEPPDAEPAVSSGTIELPRAEVRKGRIAIIDGGRRLVFDGVRVSLRHPSDPAVGRPRVSLHIARGGGDWDVPRLDALAFPLDVTGRLEGAAGPWERIAIDAIDAGGKPLARQVVLELDGPEDLVFAGDLVGLGLHDVRGSLDGDLLEVGASADRAELRSIAPIFIDAELPRGRCSGPIDLRIPLDRIEDFRIVADLDLSGLYVDEAGVGASLVGARLTRGVDGILLGEFLATRVEGAGLPSGFPPLDARGRVRWELGSGRLHLDEIVVPLRDGEASLSADVEMGAEAGDVFVRNGLLTVRGNVLAEGNALAAGDAAGPSLPPSSRGGADGVGGWVAFRGALDDPSSWEAGGSLAARALPAPSGFGPLDGSLDLTVGSCHLSISDLEAVSPRGGLRLSLEASLSDGVVLATLGPLRGGLDCIPLEVRGSTAVLLSPEDGSFRTEPIEIGLPGGSLETLVEGNLSGEFSGYVSASGVRLDPLLSALGVEVAGPETPSGSVSLLVLGSRAGGEELPSLSAQLALKGGTWVAGGTRLEGLDADGTLRLEEGLLLVDGIRARRGRDILRAAGEIPLLGWNRAGLPGADPDGKGRGDVRMEFSGFVADLGVLPIPAGTFRDIGGSVLAKGVVRASTGSMEDLLSSLEIDAEASIAGGTLKFYGSAPSLTDVEGKIEVSGGDLRLQALRCRARGATIDASGLVRVALPWQADFPLVREVDISLETKEALLVRTDDVRARGDVSLRWHGPWEATRLEGRIDLSRAYFLQRVRLTPSNRVQLPLELFSFDTAPFDAARLSIRVTSNKAITVQNNLVSTRATADLLLSGTGRYPALTGYLSTDEGSATVGNASLKLTGALVEFTEADPLNPQLRVSLGQRVRGYDVKVFISGALDSPEVALSSSPPLPQETIALLVMTGMTPGEIERQGANRVAATQAAVYLGRQIMQEFSSGDPTEESFFDDVSIETESAEREGYEDPLRVEYRVFRDVTAQGDELFLQGERDTYGDYNMHVGIRYRLD